MVRFIVATALKKNLKPTCRVLGKTIYSNKCQESTGGLAWLASHVSSSSCSGGIPASSCPYMAPRRRPSGTSNGRIKRSGFVVLFSRCAYAMWRKSRYKLCQESGRGVWSPLQDTMLFLDVASACLELRPTIWPSLFIGGIQARFPTIVWTRQLLLCEWY